MLKQLLVFTLSLTLVAIAAVGCGNDANPGNPTTTPGISSPDPGSPTTEPTKDPPATRLRDLVALMEANDVDALRAFLSFTPTACATNVQGAGGPPDCRPGEPEGTLVPVLAIADCEGHFVREDELALDPLATGTISFVGAYRAPEGFFPEGEIVLLFTRLMSGIGEIGTQLILTDDGVTGIRYGCGTTAEEMIGLHGLTDEIDIGEEPPVPQPTENTAAPPVATPGDGNNGGISAQQAVIDAARAGDVETLRSFVRATGVACVTVVEGIGGPPQCRDGQPEGTVVQVVQVADCEGHLDRVEELQLPLYENGVPFVNAFAAPEQFAIAGDTVLVFQGASPGIPEQGIAIIMDRGAITGFYNGCGQTVSQLIEALGLGDPIAIDAGA